MAGPQLTERERRWLNVLLILGCVALFYIVVQYTAEAFYYFGDVILTFFMAWFFAFIFSPIVTRLVNAIPRLPRGFATALVYGGLATVLVVVIVGAAQAIVGSIGQFIASQGSIREALPVILAEWQARLNAIGLGQIDLVAQANAVLANLDQLAAGLVGPLQQTAVASLGVLGSVLIIVFLSIWMVIDRDRIMIFLFRLVPPGYQEEAHLLEAAVGRSFGGFLRGQAAMGGLYFLIALAAGVVFGLPFALFTAAVSGVLMLIPFFGPFVSWAPPVVVAVLTDSPAIAADPHRHDRRLVHPHEHRPAAPHGGRRRHPPDRGPRLGPHRVEDRGYRRSDLRDPVRGGHLGDLLPLPPHQQRAPVGRRAGGRAGQRTGRPAGPGPP